MSLSESESFWACVERLSLSYSRSVSMELRV
jgi:hypothetical protein